MKTIYEHYNFNKTELESMLENGYVKCVYHNSDDGIVIYDYTGNAMIDGVWNNVTNNCRGLVVNKFDNTIVGYSIPKFHNMEEVMHTESFSKYLTELPLTITKKLDGSCIFISTYKDGLIVNTRGSFHSVQSTEAKSYIPDNMLAIMHQFNIKTIVSELIHDCSRVVVTYPSNMNGLHMITSYDIYGNEIPYDQVCVISKLLNIGVVPVYKASVISLEQLSLLNTSNEEGFVVQYEDGYRIKVKFEDYKRLHKFITGINEKRIWEILSNNQTIYDISENLPNEFKSWALDVQDRLLVAFKNIHEQTILDCDTIIHKYDGNRRDIGMITKGNRIQKYVFHYIDNRFDMIKKNCWKEIEPIGNVVQNKNFSK